MANSCVALRTMLAAQTPVYDEMFLQDWKPLDSPVMGKHQTEVWKMGTGDTHIADRIEIGQPNLTNNWQRINGAECQEACAAPRVNVSWGSTRTSHYMEQFRIESPLMCLTQLRYNTRPSEQITQIYNGLKKIVMQYETDWMRTHAFDLAPKVQIAGSAFNTFVPQPGPGGNVAGQLTEINLGSSSNLPTSELTFPYLDYLTTDLGLEGYSEAGSGLPDGMYNLVTDKRTWFKLTNGAPDRRDMMALTNPQDASPLYKIGMGIQKPFGDFAVSLDTQPIRFQNYGNGILNRVFPYYNVPSTTGFKRVVNPAYINARYQLSYIWHPKAIKLWTPDFKKIHEKVPTMNSAMFGSWQLVNNQGLIQYTQPDGTVCTKNNDEQLWFYWLSALEMGFQYMYPELMTPILHLVDGSGRSSTVDSPVCGTEPQYQNQYYSNDQSEC